MEETAAREQVGGREREREREWKREFFFFHFPFFFSLYSFSLFDSGHPVESQSKTPSPVALETMPSDNEEQAVDAKTIAELTEQV